MTQIKRRVVESGLKRKGFRSLPNKKNDLWYGLVIDGKFEPKIRTFVSRGGHGAEIQTKNIQNMVKELKMENREQFFNYIKCPYKHNEYLENLRRNNYI